MPVQLERLEQGVYRAALSGTIQLNELIVMQQEGTQLAQSSGDETYVLILDVQKGTEMPFDIRSAKPLLDNNAAQQIYVIGASFHIRLIVSMIGRFFGFGNVEYFSKLSDAVEKARRVLATHH
jgi:hypothetical protein